MASAAAVVLVVGLTGIALVRTGIVDIAAPPDAQNLLREEPDAHAFIERSGGPETSEQRIEIGSLPYQRAFVIVALCSGEGSLTVGAYYPPEAQAYPEGGPLPTEPMAVQTLAAPCDGTVHRLEVSTMDTLVDQPLDVLLDVPAGITWGVAVGEYRGLAAMPAFPVVGASDGFFTIADNRPILVTRGVDASFGGPLPAGATQVGVIVRCSGSPVAVSSSDGGDGTAIPCDDPATITRVVYPAEGFDTVLLRSEGPSWVAVTIEADGQAMTSLPTAPAMPSEIAAVGFAESDGLHIAFGSLGSNVQTLVPAKEAIVGRVGGDLVIISVREADGTTSVDLWSISKAAPIGSLATIAAGDNIGQTWVDATHQQAFYGIFNADFTAEWHRVGLDGSGDTVITTSPPDGPDGWVVSDGVLAVDDSVFVIDGCPVGGPCTRVIHEPATGVTRQAELDGDATCKLIGAIDGLVVARSAPTCDVSEGQDFTVQDLDGGERRVLVPEEVVDSGDTLGVVIPGTAVPQLVYAVYGDAASTYRVVSLDGGEPRDLGTITLPVVPLAPSQLRLPLGDWILLARDLADSPLLNVPRPAPRLINVTTGETIELVNLPHPGS